MNTNSFLKDMDFYYSSRKKLERFGDDTNLAR